MHHTSSSILNLTPFPWKTPVNTFTYSIYCYFQLLRSHRVGLKIPIREGGFRDVSTTRTENRMIFPRFFQISFRGFFVQNLHGFYTHLLADFPQLFTVFICFIPYFSVQIHPYRIYTFLHLF